MLAICAKAAICDSAASLALPVSGANCKFAKAAAHPYNYCRDRNLQTAIVMTRAFTKMHGLGNDFVVVDARAHPFPLDNRLAAAIADRKQGIGCDQLIILEPAEDGADVRMRIRNADGGEVEACGNASRCVAQAETKTPLPGPTG